MRHVYHKDTHSTVTQQYQPPSDTRTTPFMVWYRGRGHVECICSCMVQAMLESVYAVWVCFWLQYVLK